MSTKPGAATRPSASSWRSASPSGATKRPSTDSEVGAVRGSAGAVDHQRVPDPVVESEAGWDGRCSCPHAAPSKTGSQRPGELPAVGTSRFDFQSFGGRDIPPSGLRPPRCRLRHPGVRRIVRHSRWQRIRTRSGSETDQFRCSQRDADQRIARGGNASPQSRMTGGPSRFANPLLDGAVTHTSDVISRQFDFGTR